MSHCGSKKCSRFLLINMVQLYVLFNHHIVQNQPACDIILVVRKLTVESAREVSVLIVKAEQGGFRRACTNAQSCQDLHSFIYKVWKQMKAQSKF